MLGKRTSHNIQIKSYTAFPPQAEQPPAQMEVLCTDQRQQCGPQNMILKVSLIGKTSDPTGSLYLLPSLPSFYLSHLFHNGTFLAH